MMRSLYSGVTGLKNHQTRMDVIGNNVANVNTNGFKRGRVIFQDLLSQTIQGASRPNENRGGVNPKQVGLGMKLGAIDTIMTQGSIETTGIKTDVAISGDGFFVHKNGDVTLYTRQGNLNVDSNFNLVNPANGFKVQGWNAELTAEGQWVINAGGTTEDVTIPVGEKSPAKATTRIEIKSNLDARVDTVLNPSQATPEEIRSGVVRDVDINFYDSEGNLYNAQMRMAKVDVNTWQASILSVEGENYIDGSARIDVGVQGNTDVNIGDVTANDAIYLTFDEKGQLSAISETLNPDDRISTGELVANLSVRINDGTVNTNAAGNPQMGYMQNIDVSFGSVGDVGNSVTQFADDFSTKMYEFDGYSMGYMTGFQIDTEGVVTAFYDNGTMRDVAQLAMASFTNPNGLEKSGDTYFSETINSGRAMIDVPGTQNRGTILPGSLEMSNVNLADEFTDMIVTQRGFQANSRTITTSDQMLQELLTLKR
jgi:flagellar hook protein FlgE